MNKQELQKKYQEIVLKTNGGNDDYVVALCQIANAINELDDPKQHTKWQKLKEWLEEMIKKYEPTYDEWMALNYDFYNKTKIQSVYKNILEKMQELEGENE